MEQSKVMEYESRKASSDDLKPRKMNCLFQPVVPLQQPVEYAINRLTSIREWMCFLVCINCRLSFVPDKAFCNSDCDVLRKMNKERLLEVQNVSRAR